ncbi:hypothetical protein [Algoriphagus machipongonensis]|uniref:Lipoprotein n=1 Tax=Algoriphagus machipongonensis TaxID=388413 RepID=A3HVN7_9BACT|nr:hypothetical protein [Algoriphagus machipongonensis]EAZ82209.1 hypothetical protein ALPR1_03170 [Algoriphagus machipongonensis]
MKIFNTKLLALVTSALLLGACSQMATYDNEDLTLGLDKADQSGFKLSPYGTSGFENASISVSGDLNLTYNSEICFGETIDFSFGGVAFTDERTVQIQQFINGDWVQVFQEAQASSGVSGSLSDYGIGSYTFRWKVSGRNGVQNIEFIVVVKDCSEECTIIEDTGYVGDLKGGNDPGQGNGNNGAWWYAFDTEGESTQNVYENENVIGSATYNDVDGTITINLLAAYSLVESSTESVKWYSYADGSLPTDGRPTPGHAPNKNTDLVIDTNGDRYYVIHLDVQSCSSEE